MDLQQEMYVVGHNGIMVYCNCRVMAWDIIDPLPHNNTKVGQWSVLRAINDRPYILPKQIFAFFCADSYEIGVWSTVIIFCQAVLFSLWKFHVYHPFGII